jgi:hypothetical protein
MPGYSKTPLVKKLGIREGDRVKFLNIPEGYQTWIDPSPEVTVARKPPYDFVHLFVNQVSVLEKSLVSLREEIDDRGMIWVSWYKKSSGMSSEVTEDIIRDTALALGLVDVKVCAVTEEWSGLKLVIRVENRK